MTISTTPTYGLPWPESDEPVTSGWAAIRDLAVAVESQLDARTFEVVRAEGDTDGNGYAFVLHGLSLAQRKRIASVQAFVWAVSTDVAYGLGGVQYVDATTAVFAPGPAGAIASSPVIVTFTLYPTDNPDWT